MGHNGFKTRCEIVAEYGFSRSTFYRKLKKQNISLPTGLLDLSHQKLIYEHIGWPYGVDRAVFDDIPLPPPENGGLTQNGTK